MNMYGGRESLQRDCHGHYFFASNVKLTNDRDAKRTLTALYFKKERKSYNI